MEEKYDAIIVGAGFSGVYNLIRLRDLGLRCKMIEAGSDFGGTWYWNRYPGARVDSDIPFYEFTFPELWKDWTWSEKFPGWKELQAYFAYVDNKLDLRKHCRFDSRVTQAHWDDKSHIWHVTSDGQDGTYKVAARYLILCTGITSKSYTPDWKGLGTFKGKCTHTAKWPKEGIETSGKRVGIIGTGASGVQLIQEIGKHVEHLTVFQRTPNLAIPMRQCNISEGIQSHFKQIYEELYRKGLTTPSGFAYETIPRSMMEDTKEEQEKILESLWHRGGFAFVLAGYKGLMLDKDNNDAVYAFWRNKVGQRVKDPKKRELLAPTVAPHPFCSKRPCLEQYYYEIFNQDNVDIVDTNTNPILEITSKGVRTTEREHNFDVLIFATGFDGLTGALFDVDLRGLNGETIQDHWQEGTFTYLGMTIDNFPNLFFAFGPQGPTAGTNGPTVIETQSSWIAHTIDYLRKHDITKFIPTSDAAAAYKKHINELYDHTLYPQAKSWYNGSNIPGKTCEAYSYTAGIAHYRQEIMNEIERGYPGFERELVTSRL